MKRLLACSLFAAATIGTAEAAPLDRVAADARAIEKDPDSAADRAGEIRKLANRVEVPDSAGPVDAALKRAAARLDDDVRIGDPTLTRADAAALAGEAERLRQTLTK
jgi:hypothetical protein